MKTSSLGILAAALLGASTPLTHGAKVSVSFFYDSLEPYGDWVQTDAYGYVWHPKDVDDNWRPYTVGNWAYTDAGWTWVSEEPFGWATYHYGRWANLEHEGWVWVPETEWAPAWVSWRNNDKYVGWAPLPPEARFEVNVGFQGWVDSYYDIGPTAYSFVAVRDLGAPRLREVIVEPRQNITIVNETRNITQITYNRNVIINEGPRFEAVSRVTAQPIRRLHLEREVNIDASVAGTRTDRFAARVSGESLRVVAPEVAVDRNLAPRKVAQRLDSVQVNRGWRNAGEANQVEQLRQRIASEQKAPASLPARANLRGSAATSAAPGATSNAESNTEAARTGRNQPATADTPGNRPPNPTVPAPTPGRQATTPGAEQPNAERPNTERPNNERLPRNSRQPGEAGKPAPGRETPSDENGTPGATRQPREGRTPPPEKPEKPESRLPGNRESTPGTSRQPGQGEPSKPESRREGTKPESSEQPNANERERRPGQRPGAEKSNNDEKTPPILEGPGRRAGKTNDTDESKEPKNRRNPEEATPPRKSPDNTPDEPKTRRPGAGAGAEERSSNEAEKKPERAKPAAKEKEESSPADEGAKRKTPSPRTERSEHAEKSDSQQPPAEKRRDGAAAERKDVPKGAEKKDKD